ncbi:MAG TPA: hypothetical protein VGU69_15400, partial [Rhizomicrobium sp.]|nr:hypothetical protein [Rhizomicrobium sp.]
QGKRPRESPLRSSLRTGHERRQTKIFKGLSVSLSARPDSCGFARDRVTSPLIAGSMACAMFLRATGVQFAVKSLSIRTIFLLGSIAAILSMLGVILAVNASIATVLIIAALLAGAAQGLGQLGGLTLIGLHVPTQRRAEANSVLNFGGYFPAGLLPVATGYLIDKTGLAIGASSFAAALAACAVIAAIFVAGSLKTE